MVKLAPAERAPASTVIPAGSAANLRRQQTQNTIILYSRTVLPKTTCELLQQKNAAETILKVKCLCCTQLSQAIKGRRKKAWTRFIAFSLINWSSYTKVLTPDRFTHISCTLAFLADLYPSTLAGIHIF